MYIYRKWPGFCINQHQQRGTGGHWLLHLPWLYCDQQSVPWHRDRQAYCQLKASQLSCQNWARRSWITTSWSETLNSRYIRHASLAPCCTAVSPGQRTPDRRTSWKDSICIACSESWVSRGRTKSPMPLCWWKQAPLACISPALAQTCASNGEWSYTQGSPVWWACYRILPSRSPGIALLGHLYSKCNLRLTGIDTGNWEVLAADHSSWRYAANTVVSRVARGWESLCWRRRENKGKRGSRM